MRWNLIEDRRIPSLISLLSGISEGFYFFFFFLQYPLQINKRSVFSSAHVVFYLDFSFKNYYYLMTNSITHFGFMEGNKKMELFPLMGARFGSKNSDILLSSRNLL